MMLSRREMIALLPAAALAQQQPKTSDWPQWHGPNRNNLSTETGLLKQWPQGGPKPVWTAGGIGAGYGSLAIRGDRIYVQGAAKGKCTLFALDRSTGKHLWNAPIGRTLDQDRGPGPRSTPTVDGDRIYVLTENGDLASVNDKDAYVLWSRNILEDFGGSNPHWLISESPLIDGEKLIVTPGGRGGTIVALEKTSGKEIWRSTDLKDGAGYASCIVADVQGLRTIMTLTADAGVGVRADNGKLLWRYEKPANGTANCATPVYSDKKVFYTSAYGTGCGLLNLSRQGDSIQTSEAYFSRDMQNHHGGVVLVNGKLYGFSNAILTCMDFATGQVHWRNRSVGKGSLTYADGMLYLLGESNQVGLAEATPEDYREKGRFSIPDQGLPSWAHPVVCGSRLYIRDQGTLNCYDIRA